MLYDVLPPLLLFASLGGIILVVSRIVVRMKRLELSEAIQTEGQRTTQPAHQLLNPKAGRIKLMQSRLAAAGSSVKQSVASLKDLPARVRSARHEKSLAAEPEADDAPATGNIIAPPRSSWRERLGGVTQKLRTVVPRRRRRAVPSAPAHSFIPSATPPPPAAPPKIQLRHIEEPSATSPAPRVETTAQRLQALVRRQRATTSPVAEAQAALENGNLSQVEDILVPYLVKHPKNTMAYMLLGEVAAKRESWSEAMEIFEQVVRLDAAAPNAYAKLGEAAWHAGRFTRALEALQRAHDVEPENVPVLKHLYKISQRMDNRVLQKSVLERLQALAPDDEEVRLAVTAAQERERNHTQPA